MRSVLKKSCLVVLSVICFFVAKTIVMSAMENSGESRSASSDYEEKVKKELAENGVNTAVAQQVIDSMSAMVSNKKALSTLEEAYGNVSNGTTKEIRLYLNSQPERKALVGHALVKMIEKNMALPIQLDEYTSTTGLHYSELEESIVYHYLFTDEIISQFEGELEVLRSLLAELNPDGVCETALQLLGQGFDMTYSYRDFDGKELFTIVRTYEECERQGYDKYL